MELFRFKYGIIPACDVKNLNDLKKIIEETSDIEGIGGYKIGAILVLKYGLSVVCEKISSNTDLPIIYDHQKLGTDIPDVCGGDMLEICKDAGVHAVIIFPQSGPETLKSTIAGCYHFGLIPIVGGEMTHEKYLINEGGYISDNAPERMYLDAAELNVEHFVIPGTKVDKMEKYRLLLEKIIKEPKFLFPGIGKEYQGGDIIAAFEAVKPLPSYAIVGRAIYAAKNIREAAERLCKAIPIK